MARDFIETLAESTLPVEDLSNDRDVAAVLIAEEDADPADILRAVAPAQRMSPLWAPSLDGHGFAATSSPVFSNLTGGYDGPARGPVRSDGFAAANLDLPQENGSVGTTVAVAASGDQGIDGLLAGIGWAGGAISYSDPTAANQYQAGYPELLTNFQHIDAQQIVAMHFALSTVQYTQPAGAAGFSVSGFTGLDITYAGSNGTGTIRLANTDDPGTAYAYYPSGNVLGGDAFFGGSGRGPTMGDYDWHTVLHELGHSLGLKHGQETNTYGAMPANLDSMEYSVMTYRSYVGAPLTGYTNEQYGYAQTYMMYDIAALQHIYGADYTTNSDDTTYTWTPGSGNTVINGNAAITPGGNRIFLTIWDGGGTDTYDLGAYTSNLNVDLAPGGYSVFSSTQLADLDQFTAGGNARGNVFNALMFGGNTASLIENAIGGTGDDVIRGNQVANQLSGGAGGDTLYGLAGNDTLDGGSGISTLYGGDGNDRLVDSNSFTGDSFDGGSGIDTLVADFSWIEGVFYDLTLGWMRFSGPSGATYDTITGIENLTVGGGADVIGDGNANTILVTESGSDHDNSIDVGDGNDYVSAGSGSDTVLAGAGNDYVLAGSGNDSVVGGKQNDTLFGDDGADSLYGGNHDDSLNGGAGSDSLDGGNGNDTLDSGNDNDFLQGYGGNDSLLGGAGVDTLNGGSGNDTMAGGAGGDSYYVNSTGDVVIEVAGADIDRVNSSIGVSLATLSADVEQLVLQGTANINGTGNALSNLINGNVGNNILNGSDGNDTLNGGDGDDSLVGGNDHDSLNGGIGNDTLLGNVGNDTLVGAAGNDVLTGGGGDDALNGGAGADTFIFAGASGHDTITGFSLAQAGEIIDISAVVPIVDFADLVANHLSQVGADAVITWGTNTVTLTNILATSLTAGDFVI